MSVTLGLLSPHSGRADWITRASREAIAAAVALAREDGEVWAERLRVVEADASSADEARRQARRLIDEEGARIITGSALSEIALAGSEVADERDVLYWEVAAVANEVTTRGLRRVFRLNADASRFAATAIEFVQTDLARLGGPIERIGIVHETTALGSSIASAVATRAPEHGLRVVAFDAFASGASVGTLASVVARLGREGAEVLMATATGREAALLLAEIDGQSLPLRAVIGAGGGWGSRSLRETAGELLDGVVSVNNSRIWMLREEGLLPPARSLARRYRDRCAAQGVTEPLADRDLMFLGTDLLLRRVLPRSRSLAAADLRDAALAIDVPAGGTVAGMGVRFDETGHNTRGRIVAMQWQQGRLVTVAPERFATHALLPDARRAQRPAATSRRARP